MSSQEQQDIVRLRFKKALAAFAEAEFLFAHKYWNTTVNKLYYSCFYAIGALLANIEVFPKTHSGTQQMFRMHFIKTGHFDNETNNFYTKLFEMRQDADYEDAVDYEEEDVIILIEPARELISKIQKLLFPQ